MKNRNCKQILFVFIFSLSGLFTFGQNQIKVTFINDIKELPKNLMYKGKVKQAFHWVDKMGDNFVLMTETGEYPSKNESYDNYRDAELYAYHFLLKSDSIKQIWKIYDFIKNCPVEIKANFIKNTFQVTDLNRDGIGEIWLMYKVACYGDVSPSEMKIIMFQGHRKFAMRGRSKVKLSENEYEGGEYKFDNAFLNGPSKFRAFAKQLWNNNLLETWE